MQALPFSSAAAAGRALACIGPAQKPSPSGKCSCLSLLQVLALPPVLRQKQGRVPAERPASRFQPAGSSAWLVCLARLSDSLPAHLAARPRSGEHQGSRKTVRRAPRIPGMRQISDLVQGGAQDLLPAVRHAQGSSSQTSRGEAQEPDPGASARPAPAAFKKKP